MKIHKRSEDFSQWYQDVIREARLASHSGVRGCMVIRPEGFAIWEAMQKELDYQFKKTGHVNAYFPLLIPKSFLSKEAAHIEGFAKECAVVTHYRLMNSPDGEGVIVDPSAKLSEELIVRPTSETIIWNTYKDWISSYRDLPILINQWANVVRWEMRTRLFLRTAEFLWQEGHTAHATLQEAETEVIQMLNIYKNFAEKVMAVPVYVGRKTENEKFAGALHTYTIEGMMQDKKALQMGTSHNLGQNFAKAFDVKFTDESGKENYVFATSWGVSTRLIGALILTHSDDKGLVLPPKLANLHVIIIPIFKDDNHRLVLQYCERVKSLIENDATTVKVDSRNTHRAGFKFNEWEKKGIPLRIEVGNREIGRNQVVVTRRDNGSKQVTSLDELKASIPIFLQEIQNDLYEKAKQFRDKNTFSVKSFNEMKDIVDGQKGFAKVFWNGSIEDEKELKTFNGSIRCILENERTGKCIISGEETNRLVIIAKSY